MRLINTTTGLFEEFIGRNIPKYAILSHTWGEEEISFKDMSDPLCQNKKGYRKIAMTCQLASLAGLRYAWVDTCCIDKFSSAELTEAINSMYRWYQRSEICYVFLSDLPGSEPIGTTLQGCRWFNRGWTLQELIAPTNILFFDRDWNNRGSKRDLVESLANITGIQATILQHSQPLSSISVAQKMSWAAHRETTRIEDTAYCLLGIFNVNMPLLYGEEEKAFRRLQEEIMKTTADFSIFAWTWPSPAKNVVAPGARIFCGVLADSPHDFSMSKSLARLSGYDRRDFSISNNMIKIQAQLIFRHGMGGQQTCRYVLPLDCSWDPNIRLGILLRNCGPDQFIRDDPWTFVEYTDLMQHSRPRARYLLTELPELYLNQDGNLSDMSPLIAQRRLHALQIQYPPGMNPIECWPLDRWDEEDQVHFVSGDNARDAVALRLGVRQGFQTSQLNIDIELDIMIFVLGWSSLDVNQLLCSVVDYKSYASALKDVQSHVASWDCKKGHALQQLAFHQIPKASAVVFDIPGQNLAAMASLEAVLVSNASICQNRFWRIDISCNIYETKYLPQISYGTWLV